jgi:hypothetical protein
VPSFRVYCLTWTGLDAEDDLVCVPATRVVLASSVRKIRRTMAAMLRLGVVSFMSVAPPKIELRLVLISIGGAIHWL